MSANNVCNDYISERKLIMDSDGNAGTFINLIILAVILFKGFCTVCETAVTEIDDRKVKNGSGKVKNSRTLADLLEKPSRLVTAFAVNRVLSAIAAAYLALFSFISPLEGFFARLFDGKDGLAVLARPAAAVLIMLAAVLALTVFCEGIPKKIPAARSEKFAYFCAPFVKYLVIILTPLTALSSLLTRLLSPLFGAGASSEQEVVTEEEIRMMVEAGNETGVIEESQREMINNVFEFDDLTVSDVMTHRTDIVAVDISADVPEVVNAAISSGFSRIPVYEETIDHITGIICVKDMLCLVGSDSSAGTAKDFVRDIIYFPESVTCGEAFKRLTAKKMQMAAVIDEYGGTAGLVTMEDIVETIVGNIQDEYDEEEEELIKISDDVYTIAGTADPEKILPVFGIELPEDNCFNTMSGFIVELLGRIPEENENPSAKYGNVVFTVLVTEDKCITKIKAQLIAPEENNTNIEKENLEHEEET